MWGPSPEAADPIFPGKTGDLFSHHRLSAVSSTVLPLFIFSWKLETFFLITVAFFISLVHPGVAHYFRHVPMLQKMTAPLVGAPVWPNMLNMPKSAAGPTILSPTVFTQSEVQFWQKSAVLRFWVPFGGLEATYDDHLRLIGKRVGDFLLVLIELFSLGVTAEALRAIIC